MPRNNALYFPYINVPTSSWFTRILLYWDKVSSIIPSDFALNPNKLQPHMQDLLSAELIEQVIPVQYISSIPDFGDPFMEYIHYQIESNSMDLFSSGSFFIHFEKLDHLADELVQMGLAMVSDWPWYEVEGWVARAFMTYLSVTLGYQEDINAAPVTHDNNYLNFLQTSNSDFQIPFESRNLSTTSILLDSILPYPEDDFDIDDLLRFKEKYKDLLSSFRNHIELRCSQIASLEAGDQRDHQIDLTREELINQSKTIEDAMRSRWKGIALGSVCGVLSAGLSTWEAINTPGIFGLVGQSVGLIYALYIHFSGDDKYKNALQHPLAYSALANKQFK